MAQKDQNQSHFLRVATQIDDDIQALCHMDKGIMGLDLQSDYGTQRAEKILSQFWEVRQRIGTSMAELGQILESSSHKIEDATNRAKASSLELQRRQEQSTDLVRRFKELSEKVQDFVGESGSFTSHRAASLPELNAKLETLIEEVVAIKADAAKTNMKSLEKSADTLRQSLQSTSKQITSVLQQNQPTLH